MRTENIIGAINDVSIALWEVTGECQDGFQCRMHPALCDELDREMSYLREGQGQVHLFRIDAGELVIVRDRSVPFGKIQLSPP